MPSSANSIRKRSGQSSVSLDSDTQFPEAEGRCARLAPSGQEDLPQTALQVARQWHEGETAFPSPAEARLGSGRLEQPGELAPCRRTHVKRGRGLGFRVRLPRL